MSNLYNEHTAAVWSAVSTRAALPGHRSYSGGTTARSMAGPVFGNAPARSAEPARPAGSSLARFLSRRPLGIAAAGAALAAAALFAGLHGSTSSAHATAVETSASMAATRSTPAVTPHWNLNFFGSHFADPGHTV